MTRNVLRLTARIIALLAVCAVTLVIFTFASSLTGDTAMGVGMFGAMFLMWGLPVSLIPHYHVRGLFIIGCWVFGFIILLVGLAYAGQSIAEHYNWAHS